MKSQQAQHLENWVDAQRISSIDVTSREVREQEAADWNQMIDATALIFIGFVTGIVLMLCVLGR